MIGGQKRQNEAANATKAFLSDTTDNSSLESSYLTTSKHKVNVSETLDKDLVEPIYESKEEDNQSRERQSNSMRDIPTFGKGSFRSSKSNSRPRGSASQNRDRLQLSNSGYLHRSELPRVEPLTTTKQALKVNLVGLDMQEASFIVNQGEDPTLAIMGYCWNHKINDMALVLVIKKMVARELERRSGRCNRASFMMNSFNGVLPKDKASDLIIPKPPRQPTSRLHLHDNSQTPSSRLHQIVSVDRVGRCVAGSDASLPRSGNRVLKFNTSYDQTSSNILDQSDRLSRCVRKLGSLSPDVSRVYLKDSVNKNSRRKMHTMNEDHDRSTIGSIEAKNVGLERSLIQGKPRKVDTSFSKTKGIKQNMNRSPSGTLKQSFTSDILTKIHGTGLMKKSSVASVKPKNTLTPAKNSYKDKENVPPSRLNSYASIMKTLGIRKKTSYIGNDTSKVFLRRPTAVAPDTPNTKNDLSSLKFLFDKLDGDRDGVISTESISLGSIPRDLLKELDPIFYEIDQLSFSDFCTVIKKHRLTGEVMKYYQQCRKAQ